MRRTKRHWVPGLVAVSIAMAGTAAAQQGCGFGNDVLLTNGVVHTMDAVGIDRGQEEGEVIEGLRDVVNDNRERERAIACDLKGTGLRGDFGGVFEAVH